MYIVDILRMFKRKQFLNCTCGHEYKSMNTNEAGFCKYTITDTTYEMYVRSLWIWLTNSGPYFYLIQVFGTRNNTKFGVHIYWSQ
jgi:hypothetical protein